MINFRTEKRKPIMMDNKNYCSSLYGYKRWPSREVQIGQKMIGGKQPIALQSMTNHRPLETEANVEQSKRIIDAGGDIVRLTAPTAKDAANLKNIKENLVAAGYQQPLVADIHFNPGAAMEAALWVDKVRINPGNFAEVSKSKVEYSDLEYQETLLKIKEKFRPLVELCKQRKVAMRIGSNHGSLSQRIMSRYGDTPKGMVEAAIEYLQMAVDMDFYDMVISMKSSNIRVMVQAYRYLVHRMMEEGMNFPIHLGVTEAGNGEDGIIKSAAGNGALLYDGIGDTIRVSLTDEPENEIPIAKRIVDYASTFASGNAIPKAEDYPINPFEFVERQSAQQKIFGGKNVAIVIGEDVEIMASNRLRIMNKTYEVLDASHLDKDSLNDRLNILEFDMNALNKHLSFLKETKLPMVLVFKSSNANWMQEIRRMFISLMSHDIDFPVILKKKYEDEDITDFRVKAAMDFGPLFIDGLGDGLWLESNHFSQEELNTFALNLLQATRNRFSKADFISCPSCGRTLFDLQQATAEIKAATGHLKGIKIGIMGCIVNGPGEMADADYGYVGAGPEKINLYKGKEVVAKNIPQKDAVNALVELIKSHGDWQ